MGLVDYASSDDESQSAAAAAAPAAPSSSRVVAAPEVHDDPMLLQQVLIRPADTAITTNLTYEQMTAPESGPSNPFLSATSSKKRKNVPTGYAETAAISDATFRAQQRTFISRGYAADPSRDNTDGRRFVGNLDSAAAHDGKDVVQLAPTTAQRAALKAKRQKKGDPSVLDGENAYLGPWAKYEDSELAAREDEEAEEYEEEEAAAYTAPPSNPIIDKAGREYLDVNTGGPGAETTEFHGSEMYDYQGRTYMHVPQDLDIDLRKEPGAVKNYIPKKQIHTWRSHTKPVTALRFFPTSGHLLLSASSDSKVKIWDVYHARELLRTYSGHSKAVSDITFAPDGKTFLSCSYDRYIKLWDTETGACLHSYTTGKTPHVARFNPAQPNEFLAGMSDKKIIQFDVRTENVVQEYDHHLGPVNTITFVDDARRFMTTSDDKSLRAWEYGIPVPIKFIAEPYMYSMTRGVLHPSKKYVAYQSGDNQVVVYAATDKFRQNRKKSFRGHNNAGYAIDVDCSPDGQFLVSGDSGGWLCFWDWKSCKMYGRWQASDGPVVAVAWHPQETSKVVSAGLDCVIKYWD